MATTSATGRSLSDTDAPIWRTQPIVVAALAGIVGGIVFGMMMAMMMPNMLGMIGGLVGAPSLGWLVHLVFSAIIGAGFGVALTVLGQTAVGWGGAIGLGLVYGFVWWILGPLLIMPTWMGMGPQLGMAFSGDMLMSLMGHLIYGVVTGAVYKLIVR
jgi:hypothetical protein